MLHFCTFASVGERLVEMYDRPREVYIMAVKELLSLPTHHYTKSSLVQMSKNLHRLRNILLKHGDSTADQLFTAIVELQMNSKLFQEWKLHIGEDKNVPPATQLIKFGDKRSVILSSSENDGWRIPDCLHYLLQKHHTAFHITKGLLSNILLYMLVFYSSVDSVRMEIIHFNSAIYFEIQMWMLAFELFKHCRHVTTVWD